MQNQFFRIRITGLLRGAALVALFVSCASAPEPVLEPEPVVPLVLDQVEAPPAEPVVVVVEEVVEEKPLPVVPLYMQGRVMEVEVLQGVQSFLYLKFNGDLVIGPVPEVDQDVSEEELLNLPEIYGPEAGMTGNIYSDTNYTEKAGEFRIQEQYGDIYKAEITTLNYIIDRSALVQIQIR